MIGVLLGMVISFAWMPRTVPTPTPTPIPTPTPGPSPPAPVVPVSDFFQLGKGYQRPLIEARSKSWSLVGTQIAAGVDVDAALKAGDDKFVSDRQAAFNSAIAPALEKVAPDRSTASASSLAGAFADLAKGVASP